MGASPQLLGARIYDVFVGCVLALLRTLAATCPLATPKKPGSRECVQSPSCPGGEIGKHKGLKIPRPQGLAGSSPALGTNDLSP